ncbi:hypothetical protein NBRC110019_27660 [Neptunitalea chrysea]|uniref:N-acetyltransferase domain-containing protein n=1 Tax=Neptunitalea chrysea TaxID=1647581 RepID=A0A9W6B702_9FLAO|nr:GNAT family N-acetyltransferase [Neptunitalea chrysea]GLB53725.1 hypothetical protein NBRC110019_27660 [Neptunitalea chrysea]
MGIIKFITPDETVVVRHPVLREGKPIDSCIFPGDELPTTFHLGFYEDDELLGVVTLLKNNYTEAPAEGFQLRGMAVLTIAQGKGVGGKLVAKAEEEVKKREGTYIWMNARIKAVPFYAGLNYEVVSDVFDIPKVGAHYTMLKKI